MDSYKQQKNVMEGWDLESFNAKLILWLRVHTESYHALLYGCSKEERKIMHRVSGTTQAGSLKSVAAFTSMRVGENCHIQAAYHLRQNNWDQDFKEKQASDSILAKLIFLTVQIQDIKEEHTIVPYVPVKEANKRWQKLSTQVPKSMIAYLHAIKCESSTDLVMNKSLVR